WLMIMANHQSCGQKRQRASTTALAIWKRAAPHLKEMELELGGHIAPAAIATVSQQSLLWNRLEGAPHRLKDGALRVDQPPALRSARERTKYNLMVRNSRTAVMRRSTEERRMMPTLMVTKM